MFIFHEVTTKSRNYDLALTLSIVHENEQRDTI